MIRIEKNFKYRVLIAAHCIYQDWYLKQFIVPLLTIWDVQVLEFGQENQSSMAEI